MEGIFQREQFSWMLNIFIIYGKKIVIHTSRIFKLSVILNFVSTYIFGGSLPNYEIHEFFIP